jgi:F-type H+-transporting ATPase subunit delta
MSDFRAASRYAKSLLQLSDEQGILEKVNQDMILIDETCDANKELALVLKSPIIDHYKKSQILDKIFGKKVNPITKSFYELIGRKGREKMFHSITKEFRKQYLQLKGIEDDGLREQVKAIAVDISKMKPQLEESINKDIVGGFILNIGSRRIDASIKTKLRKLKKELTK